MTTTKQKLEAKELPIIFSAPMVRAILAGTKTVTRRIVKPQPPEHLWLIWEKFPQQVGGPYVVGQRLWVRETWATDFEKNVLYRATDESPSPMGPYGAKKIVDGVPSIWRTPIFMPRRLSRITLEITSVRVERLHEISEADARAEGAATEENVNRIDSDILSTARKLRLAYEDDRVWFAHLWDEINGKKATWESNPWVFVIEFKRLEELMK